MKWTMRIRSNTIYLIAKIFSYLYALINYIFNTGLDQLCSINKFLADILMTLSSKF